MTKQEEIREAIDTYTDDRCPFPDDDCEYRAEYGYCISGDDAYKCLLKCLDKLDVVIKVDRELPKNPIKITHHLGLSKEEANTRQLERDCFVKVIQDQMLKAGYVAVEPLIKGE